MTISDNEKQLADLESRILKIGGQQLAAYISIRDNLWSQYAQVAEPVWVQSRQTILDNPSQLEEILENDRQLLLVPWDQFVVNCISIIKAMIG